MTYTQMTSAKTCITALATSLALLTTPLAHSKWFQPTIWEGKVTRVADGDTVWIEAMPNYSGTNKDSAAKNKSAVAVGQIRKVRKVRIEGIDAPEICQAYGKTSKTALQNKLLNQMVVVDTRSKDDYGRDIAKIKFKDEDMGNWMVSQGHAWSYHSRHSNGMYAKEEQTAQSAKRGLFAQANPIEPRQFRQQNGSCFVKYIRK